LTKTASLSSSYKNKVIYLPFFHNIDKLAGHTIWNNMMKMVSDPQKLKIVFSKKQVKNEYI